MMINISKEVLAAEARIRPFIRETALHHTVFQSKLANCEAYLKLENLQHTGSFKARGALNKLLSLSSAERRAGVMAASTGNHGLAVAYGATQLGVNGTIFLPENASPQKVQALHNYDVEIRFYGNDCETTEKWARAEAEKTGQIYVSPYNDPKVVGGQGTIGIEILRQCESVDSIMVSVGGGGLISGIAGYIKALRSDIEIIGCLPQNSPVMYDSVHAGRIVDSVIIPTLSDGTAGGIEAGAITFEPCRRYVDDWVLVSENEIRDGIKLVFEHERFVIEGAAGVVVASFLKVKEKLKGRNVVLVICGGNLDIEKFKQLVFR
jgi:threonine dehydratase